MLRSLGDVAGWYAAADVPLGRGEAGLGRRRVPPRATLFYDVELLAVSDDVPSATDPLALPASAHHPNQRLPLYVPARNTFDQKLSYVMGPLSSDSP